jgi:hypothetical protein
MKLEYELRVFYAMDEEGEIYEYETDSKKEAEQYFKKQGLLMLED